MPRTAIQPPLSELAEADAAPDIKAIYTDIRRLSAVPMVALIFRHIATQPGALAEVWRSLGPLFETGRLQDAAWKIASRPPTNELIPPIGAPARLAVGLNEAGLAGVHATLDAYNRANPVNLLAMLCLTTRLRLSEPATAPLEARAWSPPPTLAGTLPPMTALRDIPPHIHDLLLELQFPERDRAEQVIPSLYRHLMAWPGFLAILHVILLPRFRDRSLARATEDLRLAMQREADALAPCLAPVPALARMPHLAATMDRFTSVFIPHMVVIGMALKRALQ